MTTSTSTTAAYVDAVAAALDDLPERDRARLLDGLEEHLGEIAEDDSRPLAQLVGTPEQYAAELRHAADLPERSPTSTGRPLPPPPPPEPAPPGREPAQATGRRRALGWWPLWAYGVAAGIGTLTTNGSAIEWFPIVAVSGSVAIGVAALVLAMLAGHWLWRPGQRGTAARAGRAGFAVVGVVGLIALCAEVQAPPKVPVNGVSQVPVPATTIGPAAVVVPDVTGLRVADAVRLLIDLGLQAQVMAPANPLAVVVVGTDPGPGTQLPAGTVVTVLTAGGAGPDLTSPRVPTGVP